MDKSKNDPVIMMKAANTDAAEQTTKLNLLYRAATGVNTAGQERLKYAS